MNISNKRKLIAGVEALVVRPGTVTAETITDVLTGFQELIKESLQGQIEVVYVMKEQKRVQVEGAK
ncbi:hypothetical protein DVA69_12650 [Acinetobacter baumannii]|uniref:hypothetical protein n=1 Tax=Acinetobacter baumannii TaxID=470 RepID=UPI000DF13B7A|nr:hypothetical protein [Acinetobacter baumannii]RCU24338.1 hypothetical protein DVA80_13590 [Acinetobacter baumannii]RCU31883.1 hypothetical protein DVA69_12650 [Acinetobacter baumannii]HAV3538555.1 hypothetical protein [Acinetobacter baumannii]HDJ7842540.1 hypothetical protein [Acinetobacter baumannii]HDK8947865.1 hypothetical protein [Acinetobacter baumannii]